MISKLMKMTRSFFQRRKEIATHHNTYVTLLEPSKTTKLHFRQLQIHITIYYDTSVYH